jgi:ppGpp synthetase/RelA/SpoT-type nucleotidyltranferase
MDKNAFLECHNFSPEEFESTGLQWSILQEIHDHHVAAFQELQTTARYITERLQRVPAVHSLMVRIKDPEHLIAKIVRKKLTTPDLTLDVATFEELITDLIGIRALHLFKGDWDQIHKFVIATWDLGETPVAYVRAGDPETLISAFKSAGCAVEEHPFGYRSIHYQIRSQPGKLVRLAELQVRTIFEEGWSEIDHRVRYPRHSDDPYLGGLLTIFNRLAGGADEMGTFTKVLSTYLTEQALKESERQGLLSEREEQLKNAVSQLKISESEKKKLQAQITELRQSSKGASVSDFLAQYSSVASAYVSPISVASAYVSPITAASAYVSPITAASAYVSPITAYLDSGVVSVVQKTCQVCGNKFSGGSPSHVLSSSSVLTLWRCPNCEQKGLFPK